MNATAYSLNPTTIDLCLMLFPWAYYRSAKCAVKVHALLDLCGTVFKFMLITEGHVHDLNVLGHLVSLPGTYWVMGRGYLDIEPLYTILRFLSVTVFEQCLLLRAIQGVDNAGEYFAWCN